MTNVIDFPLGERGGPFWTLKRVIDDGRIEGGLAMLRRTFADVPFLDHDTSRFLCDALGDPAEPKVSLAQAIKARGRGQLDWAGAYLDQINRWYGIPSFHEEWDIKNALEQDGLGRWVWVEIDLDDDEYDAAE